MGLSEMPEQMCYSSTFTKEERTRMQPVKRAKCVMMTSDSSPTLQATMQSASVVDLPDEPRAGKIVPTSPASPSSLSSRDSKYEEETNMEIGVVLTGCQKAADAAMEEAMLPIVRSTLPSPEPRPLVERNGYKDHDRTDGVPNGLSVKPKPAQRDVDDDSCLIKCVYFTQQCCECTIV